MHAARVSIVGHVQHIADSTGQTYSPTDTVTDLNPSLSTPLDVQVLALAELVEAALGLVAGMLDKDD